MYKDLNILKLVNIKTDSTKRIHFDAWRTFSVDHASRWKSNYVAFVFVSYKYIKQNCYLCWKEGESKHAKELVICVNLLMTTWLFPKRLSAKTKARLIESISNTCRGLCKNITKYKMNMYPVLRCNDSSINMKNAVNWRKKICKA